MSKTARIVRLTDGVTVEIRTRSISDKQQNRLTDDAAEEQQNHYS